MADIMHIDINPRASNGYHRTALPYSRLKCRPRRPVFVFNRMPSGGLGEIAARKSIGFAIVMDLDDSWFLDSDHYLADALKKERETIPLALAQADVVTVSTEVLAEIVRAYNENVVVVPNALPFDELQFTLDTSTERSGLVYAAGPSHREDARILADAGVEGVHLAGFQEHHAEWAQMKALLPRAQRIYRQPLPDYMRVYDGRIGALAPLRATPFNAAKSNLKVLEAGAKGKPLVASAVAPYASDLDGAFLELCSSAADWRASTARILHDAAYAAERGAALAAHVREHYGLAAANKIRRRVIESL